MKRGKEGTLKSTTFGKGSGGHEKKKLGDPSCSKVQHCLKGAIVPKGFVEKYSKPPQLGPKKEEGGLECKK